MFQETKTHVGSLALCSQSWTVDMRRSEGVFESTCLLMADNMLVCKLRWGCVQDEKVETAFEVTVFRRALDTLLRRLPIPATPLSSSSSSCHSNNNNNNNSNGTTFLSDDCFLLLALCAFAQHTTPDDRCYSVLDFVGMPRVLRAYMLSSPFDSRFKHCTSSTSTSTSTTAKENSTSREQHQQQKSGPAIDSPPVFALSNLQKD